MNTTSGRYREQEPEQGGFALDVDCDFPLSVASGYVLSGSSSRFDWVARLQRSGTADRWTGTIIPIAGDQFVVPQKEIEVILDTSKSPVEATVSFHGGGFPTQWRTYTRVSEYFHPLQIEFDVVLGSERVADFDTGTHPNKPPELEPRMLHVEGVFRAAGFDVSRSSGDSTVSLPPGSDGLWSDTELHDAMLQNWNEAPDHNQPAWAVWVLFAGLHATSAELGGIMFERSGARQRQGVAIFNDANVFKAPVDDANRAAWTQRMKFFTVCHEIGHALNLAHCWQRPDNLPWIPMISDPEDRVFMNYPNNVNQGENEFFKTFEFRFAAQELMFMRHAPESVVRTGEAAWFDNVAFTQIRTATDPAFKLEIRVNRSKAEFEFLEPCVMELKLSNISPRSQQLPENTLRDTARMTLIIKKEGKPARQWLPYVRHCFGVQQMTLAPGSSLFESIFPGAGRNGWDLAEPGLYTVQIALDMPQHSLVSNRLRLRINPPRSYTEEYFSQDFFADAVGRVIAFDGTRVLDRVNDILQEAAEKFRSRAVAHHALLALGRPKAQTGKVLATDRARRQSSDNQRQRRIEIKPADFDTARTKLYAALLRNPAKAAQTFGHIDYKVYCDQFTDVLIESDEKTIAANVQKNLYGVLRERQVSKSVLASVKKRLNRFTRRNARNGK